MMTKPLLSWTSSFWGSGLLPPDRMPNVQQPLSQARAAQVYVEV